MSKSSSWWPVSGQCNHQATIDTVFPRDANEHASSSNGLCRPSNKSRRPRTSFQEMQLSHLEDAFHKTHYPSDDVKKQLADQLNIPFDRVTVWFQNRRAKWRRDRRKNKASPYLVPTPHTPAAIVHYPNYAQQQDRHSFLLAEAQSNQCESVDSSHVSSWTNYNVPVSSVDPSRQYHHQQQPPQHQYMTNQSSYSHI